MENKPIKVPRLGVKYYVDRISGRILRKTWLGRAYFLEAWPKPHWKRIDGMCWLLPSRCFRHVSYKIAEQSVAMGIDYDPANVDYVRSYPTL